MLMNTPTDNNSKMPRISLVTPSFNQAEFLERTLRSVHEQDYPNLQHIVVDGGSTDGSIEIIERYRHCIDIVIIEPDNGQSNAINKGFSHADGDVLGWLNSDDTLLSGALQCIGSFFRDHPKEAWMTGACRAIDANDQRLNDMYPSGDFTLPGTLIRDVPFNILQPATFWRRSLSDEHGLLDESLGYCMDFELWCRFLASGTSLHVVDHVLATYRFHDASKSCGSPLRFREALIEIEKQYISQLSRADQRRLRKRMGYQTRSLAIDQAQGRPWLALLRRPWWLASQQVRAALWRGNQAA